MLNHLTGRLGLLLFYNFTIVIAAPPLTLEGSPPGSSSSNDKNTGLKLSHTAAYDALLNFYPSSSPTKLPLSSVTNLSAQLYSPPDPFIMPTEIGDLVQFGVYDTSLWLLDLGIVVTRARDDAIQHLYKTIPGPMPTELKYRHGPASFDLEVGPILTWQRWAWVLCQIGIFQGQTQNISFNFTIFTARYEEQLGSGQVRAYK